MTSRPNPKIKVAETAKIIRLFRPGTFVSAEGREVSFSAADLAGVAAAYDKASDPAPLVVGHPSTDDPAYGWVDSLSFADGFLTAVPERVAPSFAEAVRAGSYAKVSAQFYPPEDPSNPKPGSWYLKHIGFLGAHPASVKGLGVVSMNERANEQASEQASDLAGLVTVDFGADGNAAPAPFSFTEHVCAGQEPSISQQQQQEEPNMAAPNKEEPKAATPETPKPDPQIAATVAAELSFAEREKSLAAREAALAEQAATAAKAAKEAQAADNVSFAEAQIAAGVLAPAGKDLVIGILGQLDGQAKVSFGEATGELSPNAAFRKLFDSAAPVVSFMEMAKKMPGQKMDQDPKAIADEAKAYAAEQAKMGNIISVADAVRIVTKKKGM